MASVDIVIDAIAIAAAEPQIDFTQSYYISSVGIAQTQGQKPVRYSRHSSIASISKNWPVAVSGVFSRWWSGLAI